jgi:hypothetical protein
MKICYIISTCDKYLQTRVKCQMGTMLKNVNKEDIYYLTSKPDIENRHFGWYCMDDTQNITWKYIHFIYNMNIPDYDWYILIDDDTFVFEKRLRNLLTKYNSNDNYYIGKELDHLKNPFCLYMSGGAGYAISKSLYSLITEYVRKIGINKAYSPLITLQNQWCDDLCIGLWIQEIAKTNKVNHLNSNLFHLAEHENDSQLTDAITFHKVITQEQYDFYTSIEDNVNQTTSVILENNNETVFALITDSNYYNKAKRTIIDLRSKGNWNGQIVLITIDFKLNNNFKDFYNITEVKFPLIDKSILLGKIGENGFIDTTDKREINKLNQWEKLHIFDDYFKQWSRVVYLDAGLRVLDDVKYILELDYKNKILAPKDGKLYEDQQFKCQISYYNTELIDSLKAEFGDHILQSNYMLNCIWIYDTNILKLCDKAQLIEAMNKYAFCKTNEMGVMNLLFHFKYNFWEMMPIKSSNGKILFDWCELNKKYYTTWREYCFIKYPLTINFEDC